MSRSVEFYERQKPLEDYIGVACLTASPYCGEGLTEPGHVDLVFWCEGHPTEARSCVEPVGDAGIGLLRDVADLVAVGHLFSVRCGGCGEELGLGEHHRAFIWAEPHEFRSWLDEAMAALAREVTLVLLEPPLGSSEETEVLRPCTSIEEWTINSSTSTPGSAGA
jgi:hypothetical protein